MDLDALRFGTFSQLDEAIGDWEEMVKKLKALETSARDDLKAKALKANWEGANAAVSREFIGKTAGEFADARTQADTIAKILRDTRNEFVAYREQLNEAIARGLKKNLTVTDTGCGTFTVTMNVHPDRAAKGTTTPDHTQQDVDALADEIGRILGKAVESDTSAAQVLRLLVDQTEQGFSDAVYADRDSAARAVKAAEEMAALMKKNPRDVTTTELNRLTDTLARYKNDPLFAERFALDATPKQTLEFYAGIADPGIPTYDPKRGELAKLLQRDLGITLGTATRSDSSRMQAWEKELVELGQDALDAEHAGSPRGFTVMSNLMRFGDYDDDFLNDYGEKLLAFDKENSGNGLNPWTHPGMLGADLHLWGGNSRGFDPVTGFLEALGHNPDASTRFFGRPAGSDGPLDDDSPLNEHLTYLTKERVWPPDAPVGSDDESVAGRDSLGHALEAATTGYAYDAAAHPGKGPGDPGEADRRTAATAGVMEQIAHLYGSKDGPAMLRAQPEMADSLGRMGSAYVDDIDYALSGIGDVDKDAGDFPAKYDGRADFGEQGAINFLSVLGQNETSHGIVTAGQHIYTLSLLDAHPATNQANFEHGRDALSMEAEVRGILDHSRVQQAEADFKHDADEANKSLARSGEWGKYAVGAVITGGIAAIPVPGATAGAIAFAPIATDIAGEALETFLGQEIDKSVEKGEKKATEDAQQTSAEFYAKGIGSIADSYGKYVGDGSVAAERTDSEDIKKDLESTYLGLGSGENQYRGRPPSEKEED
ncbi:PPE domain-containing protein [Streptomyces roseofulvus]|uniref:DUF6571 family protein n=1 Tax=Streptomyces roseofulvus TaxID=33902 RepID=UPI0031FBC54B